MQNENSILSIKGIGEKTAKLFYKLNIYSQEDLLRYYPKTYDVFRPPVNIRDVILGEVNTIEGKIVQHPNLSRQRNLVMLQVRIEDNTDGIDTVWFNMPFLKNTLRLGNHLCLRGKVVNIRGMLRLQQPQILTQEELKYNLNKIQPVYGLTQGLTNKTVLKAVFEVLKRNIELDEYMPKEILERNKLINYSTAIHNIHFPKESKDYEDARLRLAFDEFFLFQLGIYTLKGIKEQRQNHFNIHHFGQTKLVIEQLPFKLTNAQQQVWQEILKDISGAYIMNRLVQGDVGSGKTILAVLALVLVVENGYQGALMAPTEVLAQQHFESLTQLLMPLGIRIGILTGSMTAKEKRKSYQEIEAGNIDIVVGTHALIQEKVNYKHLALVITDEQHRFGVRQRESLANKGEYPHVLVMSATPIPRTLALIIYGDLDISSVNEMPPNRQAIKNCVIGSEQRGRIYKFVEEEVKKGRQVYFICPMVTESEHVEAEAVTDYVMSLRESLNGHIVIEQLHGKMKPKEKNDIMERFSKNEVQVLVSTTVIEVGVNVPNATVMVIENAERFGLAQLHQLRGRVGRGKHQSYCIFVNGSKNQKNCARLEILNKSNDGFYIAEEDLKLRGPGDMFGVRQSGSLEFKIGNIFKDFDVLTAANHEAKSLLEADEDLVHEYHQGLKEKVTQFISENLYQINL